MTLFFVNKATVLGKRTLHHQDPQRLVWASDVVVIVGRDDEWVTTKDRHDAHGQVVHPERRGRLLAQYQTVVRPTNGPAAWAEE
jgi:hypothetical protein